MTPHEIRDRQLGPLQTIGSDVRCQHAARTIEDEDDVFADCLACFFLLSPLWPREREPRDRQDQQRVLEQAAEWAVRARQFVEEAWRSDSSKLPVPRPTGIPLQADEHQWPEKSHQQPARFGEMRVGEVHGEKFEIRGLKQAPSPKAERIAAVSKTSRRNERQEV